MKSSDALDKGDDDIMVEKKLSPIQSNLGAKKTDDESNGSDKLNKIHPEGADQKVDGVSVRASKQKDIKKTKNNKKQACCC